MKKSPSVSFLLPGLPTRPAGGFKVALEYANYLAGRGYDVHILYPDTLYFNEKSLLGKIRALLHYPYSRLKRFSARNWFKLDSTVREHHLFSLNPRLVPETDYYVATARATPFCAKRNVPAPAQREGRGMWRAMHTDQKWFRLRLFQVDQTRQRPFAIRRVYDVQRR